MISRITNGLVQKLALVAATVPIAFNANSALADSMKSLTVVELFTSQGCSSCPPANANLIEISKRPGVLALSYGVTYWDRLGWKDIFANRNSPSGRRSTRSPLERTGHLPRKWSSTAVPTSSAIRYPR